MKTTDELRRNFIAAGLMLMAVLFGAAIFVGALWVTQWWLT